MTNMSDTGNYFTQPDTATSFTLHAIAEEKFINAMPDTKGVLHGKYNDDNEVIIITGSRMDGDDTLMSAEERRQIISAKKSYKVSA